MNNGNSNLLVRWLVLAVGVALAARFAPGIDYRDWTTLMLVVLLLSLFNAFLKPLLVLFTLPLVVLSAGIGLWVINAFLLLMASRIVDGFTVRNWGSAMLGSLIISITNIVFSSVIRIRKEQPRPGSPPRNRPGPPPGKGDVIDV
jgi:putative membrane protein